MKSIPPEVVQLIYIDPIDLITDNLEFPFPFSNWFSLDQISDSIDLVILQVLVQTLLSNQVHEQLLTGQLMSPFHWLFLTLFGYFCHNVAVESVAIGAVTQVMK